MFWREESASHPLPLLEGVPQVLVWTTLNRAAKIMKNDEKLMYPELNQDDLGDI